MKRNHLNTADNRQKNQTKMTKPPAPGPITVIFQLRWPRSQP